MFSRGQQGLDLFGEQIQPANERALSARFGVPPFSVLDARQGYWQERKRAWLALGIQSEVGREENALGSSDAVNEKQGGGDPCGKRKNASPGGSPRPAAKVGEDGKIQRGDGHGRAMGEPTGRAGGLIGGSGWDGTWVKKTLGEDHTGLAASSSGTSIFDPVLCELAYRWFSPPGGLVLDPFAGGSVRGIVASRLGRSYVGIDLRPEQVAANEEQAARITPKAPPRWITGDSKDVARLAPGAYDFLFSCPPYADLERYSEDPRDLSTMDYDYFLVTYRRIIAASVRLLRPDRYACFVVGEVRDKDGLYRGLVPDTIAAFEAAGARYYNETILVTTAGSLPIRVRKQFEAARKLGKTHQNVLVFCKGDPRKATQACGECEVGDVLGLSEGAA